MLQPGTTEPFDPAVDGVDAPPVFSAVLHPHRSLAIQGVRLVVLLVAAAGTVASIPFLVMGFWPVAGFYGLDVALLWFAMSASLRGCAGLRGGRGEPAGAVPAARSR